MRRSTWDTKNWYKSLGAVDPEGTENCSASHACDHHGGCLAMYTSKKRFFFVIYNYVAQYSLLT